MRDSGLIKMTAIKEGGYTLLGRIVCMPYGIQQQQQMHMLNALKELLDVVFILPDKISGLYIPLPNLFAVFCLIKC